ncbi:MAG: hypothetical protein NUV34_03335 [Sulfuricaulis sp.]|nr:hypothetical protein [Sulfuricaulis sp.]
MGAYRMSDQDKNIWTLPAYIIHNEALRGADEKFQRERDLRYQERDAANKEALRVALSTADKLSLKIDESLTEYKEGSNEWRKTVSDLIALQRGGKASMNEFWTRLIAGAAALAAIAIYFKG